MQKHDLDLSATGFRVLGDSSRSQAATMVLAPGSSTGGPENRHSSSDQWLLVLRGTGTAVVEGDEVELTAGTLILVEAGEAHEIRCTGGEALETVNVYSPPAY